jgi:rhodanese-related sulfurtransferase
MHALITCDALYSQLGLPAAPSIVDVRLDEECSETPFLVPGTRRTEADHIGRWAPTLPRHHRVAVVDARGDGRARAVAETLAALGHHAMHLEGGVAGWMAAGRPTVRLRTDLGPTSGSRWVTRARPKIDRLACPWLIRRFIDPEALFFYVPAHRVRAEAEALGAQPYDIADVVFSHRGSQCSFDAFLREFDLRDPVLDDLALIVRAADTGELEAAPQAGGLLAISLGLSLNFTDDLLLLDRAMPMYDGLYTWCKTAREATHGWPKSG